MLQETQCARGINFPGYQVFETPGVQKLNNQGYKWGVATLVRNDLLAKQLTVSAKINQVSQVVRVSISLAKETVEVYNVYNPGGAKVNLEVWLSQAGRHADHQIIAGDFNIHHSCWGKNNCDTPEGRNLLESVLDSGKHCIMNDQRDTFRSTSAIDLFITTCEIANISQWDLYDLYSDHHAMILRVGLDKVIPNPKPVHFDMSSADWEKLNAQICEQCNENPSTGCDEFSAIAYRAMQACIDTSGGHFAGRQWFSNRRVRKAKRTLNHLLRKLRANPNEYTEDHVRDATAWVTEVSNEERDRKWKEWCTAMNWQTTLTSFPMEKTSCNPGNCSKATL